MCWPRECRGGGRWGVGGREGSRERLRNWIALSPFSSFLPTSTGRKQSIQAVGLPKANKQSKCRQTYLAASLCLTLRPCRARVMYDGMLCHLLRHTGTRTYNAKKGFSASNAYLSSAMSKIITVGSIHSSESENGNFHSKAR